MTILAKIKDVFAKDFLRIFPLLGKALQARAGFVFLLMFLQSVFELLFILSLTDMASAITNSVGLRNAILYRFIFYVSPSLGVWAEDPRNLLVISGCIVIFYSIVKSLISYTAARHVALLGEDMSLSIGEEIMQRFLQKDYAWHLSPESGAMFQRMMWRPQLGAMLTNLLMLYTMVLTVAMLFLCLMGQEPLLTTLTVSITLAVGVIFFRQIRKKVDISAKLTAESSSSEMKALLCATKGIREVLIYGQQSSFLKALVDAASKGREPRTFTSIAPTTPTWLLEAVGFIVVVLAISVLVFIEHASLERISAALGLLVLTAWRVLPYCNRVVSLQISIRGLRPMALPVVELLESLRSQPFEATRMPDPNFKFVQNISLNDVSFSYAGANESCLKNICMTIKKGEKVGLIGSSGGGKSTLAGVLSGLLPCTAGYISVDGKKLTPSGSMALAKKIGYVPQAPFLFAGTLAENVAFSEWGKAWDVERMAKACSQAAIDFVDTHPRGYELMIGENGAGLSGGQAQRVSIARALYATPSLLIFDEATSALDQHNEKAIQQTIEALSDNVTCLIIAHRLSTVENCDRVIWIEKGEIVMDGLPEDVLKAYVSANDFI